MNRTITEGIRVPFSQPQTVAGVAAATSPGWLYTFWTQLLSMPVEKWVSIAALVLTVLQIIFLVRDRFKKRRSNRKGG